MGKVSKTYADVLIDPIPDRNVNRIFIFKTPKGGVGLHYRNFKYIFAKQESIDEVKNVFKEAREEFERRRHLMDYEI